MKRLLPLLLLTGCGSLAPEPHWSDQLHPDSPCYEVNLLDGLDESSTAELRDLYDCVNYFGHVEALGSTVNQLEVATSRDGAPAGVELAIAVNQMPKVDVDPFAIGGILLDALNDPDVDFHSFLDVGIELIYGRPASQMRSGDHPTDDLSKSVLASLGQAIPPALTILLDEDLESMTWLGDLIVDPETKRWLRTGSAYLESADPQIHDPLARALPNLGHVIAATQDAGNDRWPEASGNSLRDLAWVFIVQRDPLLEAMSPDVALLVSDPQFNQALETELVRLHADGNLQATPAQLAWMASVDLHGDPLTDPSEPSALYRFLRLLSSANQQVDCNVLGFQFNDLGNLAVAVLEIIADMDPDTAQGAASIIAVLTDNFLADWMLHGAVDLNVCPVLTHDLVDDLVAVDVLTEPEATDLLTVVVGVLDVAKNDGQQNHIPHLADALKTAHDLGGTEPMEELFRDVGDQAFISDLVEVIPVLADPEAYGITAGAEAAVDLSDALGLLEWAFAPDAQDGKTGLQWLRPLLRPVLLQQGTWDAMDRIGALLRTEGSATAGMLELVPPLLKLDPELALLDHLGPLLGETAIAEPLLRALEAPGVLDELLRTDAPEGQDEAPIAFLGRLLADGTFDDLLRLIDRIIGDVSTIQR